MRPIATGMVVITQLAADLGAVHPAAAGPAGGGGRDGGRARAACWLWRRTPRAGRRKLLDAGTLAVLDNQVDSTTGTIKLKATFPNSAASLWPGGFVSVRLRTEVAKGAIVVPPSAIQRGPRGPYVFVIGSDNTAKRQQVTRRV